MTKTSTIFHIVDKRFHALSSDGQRIMIDGEAVAKTGMSPMDLLLNAVGSCAAFDIVEMIKKKRLNINSYKIELTGTRPDAVPAPYTHIHAKHIFDVEGLKQKTAERFVDLGMNKYCSVATSLRAEISFEVVLENNQSK